MRTSTSLYYRLCLSGIIVTSPCYAQQGLEDGETDLGGYIEGAKWQEGNVVLPSYPQADSLIKVDIDRGGQPLNFYVDPKSIESTPTGVVRYTVVIESSSGSKNVLYEGIRCLTGEFRTYAYGSSSSEFVEARTSKWADIQETGAMIHRDGLFKHYLCSDKQIAYPASTILQRMRYPEDFQDDGEREF